MKAGSLKKHRCILHVALSLILVFFLAGCSTSSNWFSFSGRQAVTDQSGLHSVQILPDKHYSEATIEHQYKLARHFQNSGKHHIAVKELIKVLKMDPNHANAHNALGVSYDQLKLFDLAQDAYRAAVRLDPNLAHVYNNIGYSYLLSGDPEKSQSAFKKAIELDSTNATYLNNHSLLTARYGEKLFPRPITPFEQYSQSNHVRPINAGDKAGITDTQKVTVFQNGKHAEQKISPITAPKKEQESNYYSVQIGAYYDLNRARRDIQGAIRKGYPCPYITQVKREKIYYRVRFGQFESMKAANDAAQGVKDAYAKSAFPVVSNFNSNSLYGKNDSGCRMPANILPEEGLKIGIEISNGNGVNRMARHVGNYLSKKGYSVAGLSNADHFNHPKTVIYYYPGFYDSAKQLVREFPELQTAGELVESTGLKNNIKVVIGKDIVPFKEKYLKPV